MLLVEVVQGKWETGWKTLDCSRLRHAWIMKWRLSRNTYSENLIEKGRGKIEE